MSIDHLATLRSYMNSIEVWPSENRDRNDIYYGYAFQLLVVDGGFNKDEIESLAHKVISLGYTEVIKE